MLPSVLEASALVGTREITFAEALNEAMAVCLEADPTVYLMGLGVPDPKGVFGTTLGLQEKFGVRRVMDMPTSENAMTGVAFGSALVGMRPVLTHQRLDFALLSLDQIVNQAAKWHYMFGGKTKLPLVIRMIVGRGGGQGPQHTQRLQAWFAHTPGLKVVMPATPYDAKGLLKAAIRDEDPVMFIEHTLLYGTFKGEVPDGDYLVPIGKSDVKRSGKDLTIVTYSRMVQLGLKVADTLAKEGIDVEIIDLRTLRPLDMAPVYESVAKTNRALILEEDWRSYGVGAEIAARIQEECFDDLDAPVKRLGQAEVPLPYSRPLERLAFPDEEQVSAAIRDLVA